MSTRIPEIKRDDLCAICASVDFEGAVDIASTAGSLDDEVLHDYDTFDSKCPLCQIFLGLFHGRIDGKNLVVIYRRSSSKIHSGGPDFPNLMIVPVTGERRHTLNWQKLDTKIFYYLVNANAIDFDAIKAATQLCRETHLACRRTRSDDVPNLKLIDCETREIVSANVHAYEGYAALSYVWGQLQHGLKHNGALPQSLPATIEDAIQASVKLGLRYLWIDRYCIDQSNEVELSHQIGLMDAIYRNAAITLIAACGRDPSHGLTGVFDSIRETSLEFTMGNVHFFAGTGLQLRHDITNSHWNRRAWTYQEVVFSRLRLVFTGKGVLLECNETQWPVLLQLKGVDVVDQSSPLPKFFLGDRTNQFDIFNHIQTFSGRSLSHPEDVLRALTGILHSFEVDVGIAHHWGIPVLRQQLGCHKSQRGTVQAFLIGLSWAPDEWGDTMKRNDFSPSWSWAGWKGKVGWTAASSMKDLSGFTVDPRMKFSIEMLDGRVLSWEEFLTYDLTIRQSLASQFLHLTSFITRIRLKILGKSGWFYNAQLQIVGKDKYKAGEICIEVYNRKILPEVCEALHLGYQRVYFNEINHDEPVLLIIGERNGRMERIGIARLLEHGSTDDDTERKRSEQVKTYDDTMRKNLRTLRLG
ncbi:hypothetical protein FKW77_008089 [Venturia effusa]|uniref:Heterokaryon incompatibility domain-containing protein n=1 Tax=Venturia effusa TaxID=50376 RepID=A0A517KWY5_9PEZI|nr:hypothetical protein FKW77_008089 [Venturia effusa]